MKCTNCSNEVPDTAKVCGYCGHALKKTASSVNPNPPSPTIQHKNALPGWVWAAVVGLGILIVAGILSITFWKLTTAPVLIPTSVAQDTSIPSQSQVIPATCEDKLAFVSDITVPDGTTYKPGESFTKTWRIKNIGTCTWTTNYKLAFQNGQLMGAPQTVLLTNNVPPKQEIDISVNFTAPIVPNSYKSFWQLQNEEGIVVPVDGVANNSIFVDIKIQETNANSLSNIISNSEVTYQNSFDKDFDWGTWGNVNFNNSKITIKGLGGDGSGFTSNRSIQDVEQSVLVRFQVKADTICNLKLKAGKWGAMSWRAVGIFIDMNENRISTVIDFGEPPQYLGGKLLSGNLILEPNKWYYFLIGISSDGEFDARLWDEANSANYKTSTWQLGNDWKNMAWNFEPWCGEGEMEIDEYYELTLSIQNLELP